MASDNLLRSIPKLSDLSSTTTGDWVYVGTYRDVRSEAIVGGAVDGTNPTCIVTVEGSSDGSGSSDATLATHATITDEQVGYIDAGDNSPQHAVPGEDPIWSSFNTGAYGWIRHVATLGGTSPVFNDFSARFTVLSTSVRRTGTLS